MFTRSNPLFFLLRGNDLAFVEWRFTRERRYHCFKAEVRVSGISRPDRRTKAGVQDYGRLLEHMTRLVCVWRGMACALR